MIVSSEPKGHVTFRDVAVLVVATLTLTLGACADETDAPTEEGSKEALPTDTAGNQTFGLVQMGHTAHDFAESGQAWNGTSAEGSYTYLSAPCSTNAPVNNNATNLATFNSRLPGATSPASARLHPLQFEVTRSKNDTARLEGTVSLTVCQLSAGSTSADDPIPDAEKDRIILNWSATSRQTSEEEVVFDGRFEIQKGTGRYEGIIGQGRLHGYFMCAYVPDNCQTAGAFTDVMMLMTGTYDHPELP